MKHMPKLEQQDHANDGYYLSVTTGRVPAAAVSTGIQHLLRGCLATGRLMPIVEH